jgi:hypothetical protein
MLKVKVQYVYRNILDTAAYAADLLLGLTDRRG